MLDWIEHMREKPLSVRRQVALVVAIVLTGMIVGAWLVVRVMTPAATDGHEKQPGLFSTFSDTVNSYFEENPPPTMSTSTLIEKPSATTSSTEEGETVPKAASGSPAAPQATSSGSRMDAGQAPTSATTSIGL